MRAGADEGDHAVLLQQRRLLRVRRRRAPPRGGRAHHPRAHAHHRFQAGRPVLGSSAAPTSRSGSRSVCKPLENDPPSQKALGIEIASRQAEELLRRGAPGIHFYTLNKAEATAHLEESRPSGGEPPRIRRFGQRVVSSGLGRRLCRCISGSISEPPVPWSHSPTAVTTRSSPSWTSPAIRYEAYPSVVAENAGKLCFGFEAVAKSPDPSWTVVRSFKRLLAGPEVSAQSSVEIGGTRLPLADLLTQFLSALRTAIITRSNVAAAASRAKAHHRDRGPRQRAQRAAFPFARRLPPGWLRRAGAS